MNSFEIGRLLGRLEVILENISDKDKELEELEDSLRYKQDIEKLAMVYGRAEQKMIMANKSEKDIQLLKELFLDAEQAHIEEFKKRSIEKLRLRGFPIKALNNANIFTVQDICNKTVKEIESINGISPISARRLVNELKINGIYLKEK